MYRAHIVALLGEAVVVKGEDAGERGVLPSNVVGIGSLPLRVSNGTPSGMGEVLFVAVRRFDPSDPGWDAYVRQSQLAHLREVVSLDHLLCPPAVELIDEDWDHNVHADFETDYFRDIDYLVRRVAQISNVQILAIAKEPTQEPNQALTDDRFVFIGYDLVERDGGISAITNCGGFATAFSSSDLNEYGLIPDAAKAYQVRNRLSANYPDEHHANCTVWAIWRLQA